MNQPSKETPRRPEALGGLFARPEALHTPHLGALCSAEPKAKPGPARREGVGDAMEPARGRFGQRFLLPPGDQAPRVPHHHGHLVGGALGEMDAGTEGELDLMGWEQGTRGRFGQSAGAERRSARRFFLTLGAALSLVGRAVREPHRALDRATAVLAFGRKADRLSEMAFPWRWAEALIC